MASSFRQQFTGLVDHVTRHPWLEGLLHSSATIFRYFFKAYLFLHLVLFTTYLTKPRLLVSLSVLRLIYMVAYPREAPDQRIEKDADKAPGRKETDRLFKLQLTFLSKCQSESFSFGILIGSLGITVRKAPTIDSVITVVLSHPATTKL